MNFEIPVDPCGLRVIFGRGDVSRKPSFSFIRFDLSDESFITYERRRDSPYNEESRRDYSFYFQSLQKKPKSPPNRYRVHWPRIPPSTKKIPTREAVQQSGTDRLLSPCPLGLILVRGLVFVPEINYLSNQILVVFVLYCRKPQALYVVTECEFTNTASNDLRLKANRRLRFSELKLKIKISFHLIQFSAKLTKSTIEKLISAFTEKGKREFYG